MADKIRHYVFTWNNYPDDYLGILQTFFISRCTYLLFAPEVGEQGTPHLQGYFYFKNQMSMSAVNKKFDNKLFLATPHGDIDQQVAYIIGPYTKDDKHKPFNPDAVEWGVRPMSQKRKGEAGRAAIKARWKLAKAGKFEELPPEQIKIYEYIYRKQHEVTDRDNLTNYFIYGNSGCGKSRSARKKFPDLYSKPMSKWWDGYTNQSAVLLDDIEPSHMKFIGYFLKIWLDHYKFNAEMKGSCLIIRPPIMIITSQYTLVELCTTDEEKLDSPLYHALSRRLELFNFNNKPEIDKFLNI